MKSISLKKIRRRAERKRHLRRIVCLASCSGPCLPSPRDHSVPHLVPSHPVNLFVDPAFIYAGLGASLGLLLLFWHTQRVRLRRVNLLISSKLIPKLVPSWSQTLQWTKLSLLFVAVLFAFRCVGPPSMGNGEGRKPNPPESAS